MGTLYKGPLLFALVLHCTILKIPADPQCKEMLLNCWYLDDGALAGPRDALSGALKILQANSDTTGLHVNVNYSVPKSSPCSHLIFHYRPVHTRCPHRECGVLCSVHRIQKKRCITSIITSTPTVQPTSCCHHPEIMC